jgi:hypothetical protein
MEGDPASTKFAGVTGKRASGVSESELSDEPDTLLAVSRRNSLRTKFSMKADPRSCVTNVTCGRSTKCVPQPRQYGQLAEFPQRERK